MSHATRTCPSCHTPLPGVASFCYVCGTATPTGIDMATGTRIAVTRSGVTAADLRHRVQRVLGPGYELGDRIGAGGFAEVFKAQDLRLKRSVAVKVLRPDLGLTPGMLDRFRREAEVVAALRHPNIVPIYDIGEGDGIAFILMPFIVGDSLRAVMERDGAMSSAEVRRILSEAASGLGAAHDAGVIHRDIKPENIMLEGRELRVLLMDFGIAKAVGGEEDTPATDEGVAPALTSTGIIVGTPQYMSPEQACGDKTIDARTDQYSLAVVGYRMLSGALPFEGDSTRAVLYQQLVAEPAPISSKVPDVPPAMAAAITRAMAKEPRDRYDSMADFAAALQDNTAAAAPAKPTGGTKFKLPTRKSGAAAAKPTGKATAKPAAKATAAGITKAASKTGRSSFGTGSGKRRILLIGGAGAAIAIALAITLSGGDAVPPISAFVPSSMLGGGADSLAPSGDSLATVPPAVTPQRPATPPPAPSSTSRRASTADRRPRTTPPPAPAPAATVPGPEATATCASLAASATWSAALATCSAASDAGDAQATRILAGMYNAGKGVTANAVRAFTLYQRAAPNDAEAQFQLARMYEIGRGTARDLKANIVNLRAAATAGHQQATLTLANRLETGAGMDRDYTEAATWYRRAADRGSVLAMLKLAEWSGRGRGVERSDAQALQWYTRAADAGSPAGAFAAAKMLLNGKGVPQDTARGMVLLRRAAALGDADAKKELDKRGS
jgi:serine/threonine-protein kinase